MNKKLAVLLIVCLVGSIGITTAVPPETPSLPELVNELKATFAGLQTSVSDLWGNASEQQVAIQSETDTRLSGDQALWTNASEQQNAINAIEPGSTVHLGVWEDNDPSTALPYGFSTGYLAATDGFVCVRMYNPTVDVVRLDVWTMPETVYVLRTCTSVHPNEFGSLMVPVRAGEYWIVFEFGSLDGKISWIPLVP